MHDRLILPGQGDRFHRVRDLVCWIVTGRQVGSARDHFLDDREVSRLDGAVKGV